MRDDTPVNAKVTAPDDSVRAPLRDRTAPPRGRPAPPCAMVIFGAAGDLATRKLLPAIRNLAGGGLLSRDFALVAVARREESQDAFRDRLLAEIAEPAADAPDRAFTDWLRERIAYVRGTFEDPGTYERLGRALRMADERFGTGGNYIYYFATPPSFFGEIATHLGEGGLLAEDDGWRRVVVEKPFGEDLSSARALNRQISTVMREHQVYRIDHYLGKETVQNLMVFRFANGIFEPIWNRRYVDHVQVTVAETEGVGTRGGYYDDAGALRDMVQNHLFQLLALTAMEPPNSFRADAVRDERVKVLQAIRPFSPDDVRRHVVRGQYGEGVWRGEALRGYRDEDKVDSGSTTETFAALRVLLDNWRWADVPFYLRTGKRLPRRVSEVAIQFRCAPFVMFRDTGIDCLDSNLLIIRIQPDEGISLRFGAKIPGPGLDIGTVTMDFKYADYFGSRPNTGYETLLYDTMNGDATLFHRADMVEAGWQVVTPILDAWQERGPTGFPNYAAMTWGPDEAIELMVRDGRTWRRPGSRS
jgi:glucose-6-phosphate 1-dehydrogenase